MGTWSPSCGKTISTAISGMNESMMATMALVPFFLPNENITVPPYTLKRK